MACARYCSTKSDGADSRTLEQQQEIGEPVQRGTAVLVLDAKQRGQVVQHDTLSAESLHPLENAGLPARIVEVRELGINGLKLPGQHLKVSSQRGFVGTNSGSPSRCPARLTPSALRADGCSAHSGKILPRHGNRLTVGLLGQLL